MSDPLRPPEDALQADDLGDLLRRLGEADRALNEGSQRLARMSRELEMERAGQERVRVALRLSVSGLKKLRADRDERSNALREVLPMARAWCRQESAPHPLVDAVERAARLVTP